MIKRDKLGRFVSTKRVANKKAAVAKKTAKAPAKKTTKTSTKKAK